MTNDMKYPEEIRQDEILRNLERLEAKLKRREREIKTDGIKCTSCGETITPDKWNNISENQVKAEIERPTAIKENIKFCINPSASGGVKIPDENISFGDKDFSFTVKVTCPDKPKTHYHGFEGNNYFGIQECENGYIVSIGGKSYLVDNQEEAFILRDKFKKDGLKGINEYLKAKKLSKKEVHTVLYVTEKDGTPLRLIAFNKALTIGEVNELFRQASGDRAFTLKGNKDKPFCDLI